MKYRRNQCLCRNVGHTAEERRDRSKTFFLHKKWYKMQSEGENAKMGHDIALLLLEKQLVFSDTIQPICLPQPTVQISAGTSVTINGYGLIRKIPSKIRAEHLQTGNMEIMDKVTNNDIIGQLYLARPVGLDYKIN